ncbi:MAG: peptide deformylase 2 [Candidatus Dojkabacteria bacterium]|nr:MAG: peptide deformylase 2 [Candidatus Dojkabacteria bacterium]GIW58742.1 MAG: peptide deformylase 2 [Candidatus Dojkabacteria bacterium]
MAIKKIVQLGFPTLTQKAQEVKDVTSNKVQNLIEDLLDTAKNAGPNSAGLAANQIGELLRVTVVNRLDRDGSDWEVLINPKIIKKSKKISTNWEGCLSIANGGLYGLVSRPKSVVVEYLDPSGKTKKIKANDYFSHLIQHEIDHLDGILFTKYLDDPKNLYTAEEVDKMEQGLFL